MCVCAFVCLFCPSVHLPICRSFCAAHFIDIDGSATGLPLRCAACLSPARSLRVMSKSPWLMVIPRCCESKRISFGVPRRGSEGMQRPLGMGSG